MVLIDQIPNAFITGAKGCFRGWARGLACTPWSPLDGKGGGEGWFAVMHAGHGARVPDDNFEIMEDVYFYIL